LKIVKKVNIQLFKNQKVVVFNKYFLYLTSLTSVSGALINKTPNVLIIFTFILKKDTLNYPLTLIIS